MSKTFNAFVALVRNWANRDEEVLSDAIVIDCMDYAVDKAYRVLRLPELETTVEYDSASLAAATVSSNGQTYTELSVPSDLIEFIQIRSVNSDGNTIRVFNEKTDMRTFHDPYAEKYSSLAYWTRVGSNIILAPGYPWGTEDSIQLHYYGKLDALDLRYDVTALNANTDITRLTEVVGSVTAPDDLRNGGTVPTATLKKAVYTFDGDGSITATVYYESTVDDGDIPAADPGYTRVITTHTFYGELTPNWLRDTNERVILNGALYQAFVYLNEPDTAQMYYQRWMSEIQELNSEEKFRKARGGNVQININGNGLI